MTENAGNGDSGMDFPVKSLTGHGENSIPRRYETPQMYVSLPLYSDCVREVVTNAGEGTDDALRYFY